MLKDSNELWQMAARTWTNAGLLHSHKKETQEEQEAAGGGEGGNTVWGKELVRERGRWVDSPVLSV